MRDRIYTPNQSVDVEAVRMFLYRNCRIGPGGERGAILVLTALAMFVLIGFMALVFDVGSFYHRRRVMQTAADAGALSGAAEIFREQDSQVVPSAQTATATNGFPDGIQGITVTVNRPPASGYYVGDSRYVEVLIRQPSPTFFAKIFGIFSVSVPARAVAGVGATSTSCVYTLDPDIPSLHVQSSATLATNCGVQINSDNPCAMDLDSESTVNVEGGDITITGTWCEDAGVTLEPPEPDTGEPPVTDPLGYLNPPDVGSMPLQSPSRLEIDGNTTLTPGVYRGGILIKSGVNVTVQPGVYVLEGGGLTVEGSISGSGVMFYNTFAPGYTYEPILFKNPAGANLSAPTEGDYSGVLFFQDRAAVSDDNIGNTSGDFGDGFILESTTPTTFNGTLYFPTQRVRIKNQATPRITNLLVARAIVIESQSYLNMSGTTLAAENPIKRLSLVE